LISIRHTVGGCAKRRHLGAADLLEQGTRVEPAVDEIFLAVFARGASDEDLMRV
jgi:hypothetical protein